MADTKITALTAIGANPIIPSTFPIPMVDLTDTSMAASGTTKKVTVNQILGAGGTATLASATITGDLTVDTSTLKVDSVNNRVGIGTASPTAALHVSSAGSVHINQRTGNNGCFTQYMDPTSSNYVGTDSGNFRVANNSGQDLLNIQQLGVFSFGDGAGGTRMTLNSTGLGVGTASPATKLHIDTASAGYGLTLAANGLTGRRFQFGINIDANLAIYDTSAAAVRMIIDGSGNVGIGVTPSAWVSSSKAIDIAAWAGVGYIASSAATVITNNTYKDAASNWVFKNGTNAAGYFEIAQNLYRWWQAPAAGGAGTTAAMVQAMTLDASGRLLVNTASVIGGSGDTLQIAGKTTAGTDYCSMYTGTSTTVYGARYYHTSAVVGSITFTALGTAYNIASDYRLKEAVAPLTGGLARVSALKPSIYKWKVNGSDGEGFIAHELAEVIPAAVTGQKDAVNEDGSIQPQQVDLSKIVPVLVAAIQELTARVQTLETR